MFKLFTIQDDNGIAHSSRALPELPKGNKQGDDKQKLLYLLLLDSFKKTKVTEAKEELSSNIRKM